MPSNSKCRKSVKSSKKKGKKKIRRNKSQASAGSQSHLRFRPPVSGSYQPEIGSFYKEGSSKMSSRGSTRHFESMLAQVAHKKSSFVSKKSSYSNPPIDEGETRWPTTDLAILDLEREIKDQHAKEMSNVHSIDTLKNKISELKLKLKYADKEDRQCEDGHKK